MLIDITLTSLAEFSLSLCIALLPVFLIVGICTCVFVWKTLNDIKKDTGDIYAIRCKVRETSGTVDYIKYDTSAIREILETAMKDDETDSVEENAES